MDERSDDEDRDALAGLSSVPPPRKSHSLSQQLRATSAQKRHHQLRKHSLDDVQVPKNVVNVDAYYDSSDDDFFPYSSNTTSASSNITMGAEEYVSSSQRLDQSLCMDGGVDHHDSGSTRECQLLPEFIGSGGGTGIFRVPTRAAVHPGRPPCLELRPHPLRETQVGRFLRTIACTETQLWAGQEGGVRVWNLKDAFEPGCGLGGRVLRGDEDAAPYYESANTSPAMFLMVDVGNRLIWTGHKDGKIRSWKMDQPLDASTPFKEGLSWQAHRAPVLAMVMTSYGDMWSGSEGGAIKIWPWESIEKSLSLKPEERHMAALLVERSCIDLRSQVTVNGVCSISSQDVKCLLADNFRARVWCAGSLSFSLWDARTRELVKVFNVDGQIENRVDMSSVQQDQAAVEDDMKVKFVSTSKKEKSQGFLQRSRNAIMGAADAVRRVATRGAGAFVEDAKKTEALVLTADGMIWSGCTNGLLVQWDGNGNRVQDFNHRPSAVQCFCTVGAQIYVGYVSGHLQVLDLEGNLIAGWVAHSSPVIKLAVGTGCIYSLATHGGIRGWNIKSPGPSDDILRSELAAKESIYTRRDNVRILIGTWNVGQGRASNDSLMSWLGSIVPDVGIVVVGLQEVEMGAGFLAMSAAKETVGLEGSSAGHWWLDNIGKALEEGKTFERMGSRQLAGLLIALWVKKNLRTHVGDIDAGAVPCGFGRAIGNKGGVGLRIRVYDRIMCFVNCHLAAHLEAVNRRNADFDHIYRNMVFNRSTLLNTAAAGVSTAVNTVRTTNAVGSNSEEAARPELAEADVVVFLGDFNYRLFGISYDEARDFVSQRCFDWLREKDQLRAEMKAGKVFQGMREALIRFPPTYKFERHQAGLAGYDSGEKKRIPAWCDRIIYRDNRSAPVSECSLECPVVSSILQYEACMDVTDSDHKPVRCKLTVQIAHADRSVRRIEFGEIIRSNEKIRSMLEELNYVPETSVNTNNIILQNQDTSILRITNKCVKDMAIFKIICEGQSTVKEDGEETDYRPRGANGFPRWLEVTPAAGMIKPEQCAEVSVHHEEFHTLEEFVDGIPQNWWCEDTRDKEVILVVHVQGSCSAQTYSHRIRVRHCFSAKTVSRIDSKSTSSRKGQGSPVHRDARTRELVKVFNVDGQIENRVDMSSVQQDQAAVEDDMKVKFVSTSKKEKSQGFLQRSRNAIMGAADAVRRVATRGAGAFVEDAKKTEALVLTADGMIWSGCTNGLLVQWDGNGNRVQDFNHRPSAVQCFCTVGAQIYVGYVSGHLQVLDLEGNLIAGWVAHSSPVIKLAVGTGCIYSLATHGGIRGWNIKSPGPSDDILRSELAAKESIYTRRDNVRILIGTWNVGQGRASNDSLMSWLGSIVPDVGIVVVGLQEVEMGAGFLAMSAAKETVGLEGSSAGHWWLDNIGKALEEGKTFERMGSRQLAGLLIALWVKKNLRTHVGDIDAGAVPCGFGRAIGNKGGVGLRIRVYDRIMCFVNCHLAAHLEAVNRRNADFDHIYRNMVFNRSTLLNTAAAGVSTAVNTVRTTNAVGSNSEEAARPELAEADVVVFLGDFNYRLFGISYDEARDFVSQRCFDWLREKDQLRAEMKAGKVFQGMREALIRFPPTYKFERHQAGLAGYDSGEKKRIPAWCDRIIYRDNRSAPVSECSLECPVVSSILQYEACMDVTDSDHKPVRCKLTVQIAHADRSVRRIEFGEIIRSNEKIRSMLEELNYVPETSVNTNNIILQNQDTSILRITNKCVKDMAIFKIICEGQSTVKEDGEETDYRPRGANGFPRWLEVTPAAGMIKPEQCAEVSVHHEEFHTLEEFVDGIPQNWWCEDTRDKEVILVVHVQGSCSAQTYSHRIRVRHCFSAKTVSRIDSKSTSSRKGQGSPVHRQPAANTSSETNLKNP